MLTIKNRWARRGMAVFGPLGVGWLVVVIVMWSLENFLVYQPSLYTPAQFGWAPDAFPFEDAEIASTDEVRLHGWFVPHESPRAVVLLLHGNGGNILAMEEELRVLHDELGAAALAIDYRGYGKSTGSPTEHGILDDARAARAWLAKRAHVQEQEVVLWGFSMGGGVAVDLASQDGARGLILQSTFTSLPDAAGYHYPWLPVHWLMRNRLDSARKIQRYRGPLLQSHGDADSVVPYELGRELHALANELKRFLTIAGGDHNDPPTVEFYEAVDQFLDTLP